MAVDVLFARMPILAQHILHTVTYLIFLVPFVLAMLPESWAFFMKAYTTGEQTYSVWAAPTWPVKFCLFFGLLLLAVQSVSEILKQVRGIIEDVTAKNLPATGKEEQK